MCLCELLYEWNGTVTCEHIMLATQTTYVKKEQIQFDIGGWVLTDVA